MALQRQGPRRNVSPSSKLADCQAVSTSTSASLSAQSNVPWWKRATFRQCSKKSSRSHLYFMMLQSPHAATSATRLKMTFGPLESWLILLEIPMDNDHVPNQPGRTSSILGGILNQQGFEHVHEQLWEPQFRCHLQWPPWLGCEFLKRNQTLDKAWHLTDHQSLAE